MSGQRNSDLAKRLDVIEQLLATESHCPTCKQPWPHVTMCDCKSESADPVLHYIECPYRRTKELIAEIRRAYSEGERT